jgi:CheY-like chemotaxis protein
MALVLVIDDDETIREVLRGILEVAGHEVLEAADGESGLDLHRRHQPALVIADIIMPEMDGLEVIRELRRMSPDVKVMAVTGYDEKGAKGYLALAEEYGAHRTFNKPVDPDEIEQAVIELLAQT